MIKVKEFLKNGICLKIKLMIKLIQNKFHKENKQIFNRMLPFQETILIYIYKNQITIKENIIKTKKI